MTYSEFEGIDSMEVGEKTRYLLGIVNRYNDVIKIAKEILDKECMPDVEENPFNFPGINIRSRTTSTLDNVMLPIAYSDIYEDLYNKGKLIAKVADIKEYGDDAVENLITTRKSTWLEYK